MAHDPIEMTRSVFGNWEATFVAQRRERLFNCFCYACVALYFALALSGILIFGK